MSLDPLNTIHKVEQFLREDISRSVADDLRSEVKATAKLLAESVRELDQLSNRLWLDAQAMSTLYHEVVMALPEANLPEIETLNSELWCSIGLTEQIKKHSYYLTCFDTLLNNLNELQTNNHVSKKLLVRCITLQTGSAKQRLGFQSVFKPEE